MAPKAPPGTRSLLAPHPCVTVLHEQPLLAVYAVCDEGKHYLSESQRHGQVQVRDVYNGAVVEEIPVTRETLSSVAVSPDGTLLATWDYRHTVTLYARRNGRVLATIPRVPRQFGTLCWTADSALLVALPQSMDPPFLAYVLDREGKRLPDLPLPARLDRLAASAHRSLVATAWSPGRLWFLDPTLGTVSDPVKLPECVDAVAARGHRVAVGFRPASLALTVCEGSVDALWPTQEVLDRVRCAALTPVVARVEARRAAARGARTLEVFHAMVERAQARSVSPPEATGPLRRWDPSVAPWDPGSAGIRGLHFVDDSALVTVGLDDVTLTRFRPDGAVDTLLLSLAAKHTGRITLGAVSACGDTLAIRVDSQSKTVDSFTALVRVHPDLCGP